MKNSPQLLEEEQDHEMEGLNNGYMKKLQHHRILLLVIHQEIIQDIVQNIPLIMDKGCCTFIIIVLILIIGYSYILTIDIQTISIP
jgi:hypothetical protein